MYVTASVTVLQQALLLVTYLIRHTKLHCFLLCKGSVLHLLGLGFDIYSYTLNPKYRLLHCMYGCVRHNRAEDPLWRGLARWPHQTETAGGDPIRQRWQLSLLLWCVVRCLC